MKTSADTSSVAPNLAPLDVLGRVSAGLAHDLRTPLTIVRNAVYLLRRSNSDDPKIVELLDMIDAETDAMNLILTGLNEITHSRNPEPEAIDVARVLPEVAARVDVNNLMEWKFDFDPPSIVWCDLPQFTLMMNKVFRNAVAAMKGQGQVAVRVRHDKDNDIIEVRDRGPGVAEA
ncbi:MAG TPA: HAMP domain-containing sensor histidine kinase, partial [Phycisphaerae bacterium]|nr:HAMP domain-containing sensor histidine kinase [Phycisphaerae bacterium]